jgi:hypothetical protein
MSKGCGKMVAHHGLCSEIRYGHRRFVLFVDHSACQMSRLHCAAKTAGFDYSLQSHTTFELIGHDDASLSSF